MTHPDLIQTHLSGYTTSGENHRTSSQSQIYLYQKPDAPDLFLKINVGNTDAPLIREKEAMEWLQGKLPVPRVIAYHKTGNTTYLLTERLLGISSHSEPYKHTPETTICILAKGLRTIHNVSVIDCLLPKYTSDDLIQEAENNIQNGIVTAQSLQKRGDTRTPQKALAQVQSLHPKTAPLAFTHGDYCLPNIMIHNNKLSGFIDWGSAGLSDPHRDLVSAQYSIRRNLGEEWIDPFFDQYGRQHISEDTLGFFNAIYELA
jgi:aminoglycoside phosphotransferase